MDKAGKIYPIGKWITDTISEEDLRIVGIIANVSLVEIIIGTFNQFNINYIMTRTRWTPIRDLRKTVSWFSKVCISVSTSV